MSAVIHEDADGSERRVAPRTRTLKRAKILFNNRFSTFDCIVRNISSTGALLTIDGAAHLPKTFDVCIGEDPERPAKLVYRRGMLAGIRFLDVPSEDEESSAAVFASPNRPSGGGENDFGPGDPFDDRASPVSAGGARLVRRLVPEALPSGLTRLFPWF